MQNKCIIIIMIVCVCLLCCLAKTYESVSESKYDLLGSFKLLLLQLEADDVFTNKPLRKLPLVCCPCHTFFLLLLSVCVHLCVCTVLLLVFVHLCVLVYEDESPVLDDEVAPALPRVVWESLLNMAPPSRCPHDHSQQPLPKHKDRAKYSAVEEQRERDRTANLLTLCYIQTPTEL